jgi:hypothetical protein
VRYIWGCGACKADALVEPGCRGIICPKLQGREVGPRGIDESTDKSRADTFVSPSWSYVNSSDAAYAWLRGERILVYTTDCNQHSLDGTAIKLFALRAETIGAALPFVQQPLDEMKSFLKSFLLELFYAGCGQL